MNAREQLVVAHGSDAIAYSTLQPGLQYFETSYGYIAYRESHGVRLTLGAPVCAPGDRQALAEQFLGQGAPAVFFYVAEDFARLWAGRRWVAGIGVDKVLKLGSARLDEAKAVRGAVKKAAAAGFALEPLQTVGTEARAQLEAINARYLEGRALSYEMKFLNRPMQLDDGGLGRHFALRWREDGVDAVRGYVRLNPCFRDGRPAGYLLDVLRFAKTKLWGVFYAAVVQLAGALTLEGAEELSLGYCPLFRAETRLDLPRSRVLDAQIGWLSRHLAAVPYVDRLAAQKSAFPAEDRQRYMVTPMRSAARPFLALMSASGVSLRSLLGANLVRSVLKPYLEGARA